MQTILIIVLIAFISIEKTNCLPFCDSKSYDSVFNIGHLIYFIRCGELWTYDPTIDGNEGAFIRDWSLFAIARQYLGHGITENKAYSNKDLKFHGFSFQEINCVDHPEDQQRHCYNSVQAWDHLTILFDHQEFLTLKYHLGDYKVVPFAQNPLYQEYVYYYNKEDSYFWVECNYFIPYCKREGMKYLAALFDKDTDVLYMGFSYERQICITHTKMRKMIHNTSEWIIEKKEEFMWEQKWEQPGKCFTGNLIGMFYHNKQAFVVGRVGYTSRIYEDQVYRMNLNDDKTLIEIEVHTIAGNKSAPHNIRTYFGCRYTDKEKKQEIVRVRKRSVRENSPQVFHAFEAFKKISKNIYIIYFLTVLSLVLFAIIIHLLKRKRVQKRK